LSYSNFKDPFGLLKRMLASGNRAAYFTLLREGLGVALTPVDMMLAALERRRLKKGMQSDLPILLILGGSRSGTTLFYQTLAQYLPVSYFNNLSVSFGRAPITGGKWFNRFLRRSKGNFNNYYGSVSGFNGPNDGFHIWNRWLGEDRNAIPENIPAETKADMRGFFQTWLASFNQPFLNKNNRNSLCIDLFQETFPNVYFLEIRRNPVFVVQSLIQSREAVQGSKYIAWGLGSQDSNPDQDPLSYVNDICEQVHGVEVELDQGKAKVDPARYLQVTYEEFCHDPQAVVQGIYQQVWKGELPATNFKGLEPFRNTNQQKVSDEEFQRILDRVADLYGSEAQRHLAMVNS
jgi:hypothetical protein